MKTIAQKHLGIIFRSRTEARWAEYFRLNDVEFQYEPEGYKLDGDWYVPDFYIPFANIFFEVKPGSPNQREARVARSLASASRSVVVVACGNPSKDVELIAFDSVGRQTFVELAPDHITGQPWLGEEISENCWQIPLAAGCTSRGNGRDPWLNTAGRLQFNSPSEDEADWRTRERRKLIDPDIIRRPREERRVISRREEKRFVISRKDWR